MVEGLWENSVIVWDINSVIEFFFITVQEIWSLARVIALRLFTDDHNFDSVVFFPYPPVKL